MSSKNEGADVVPIKEELIQKPRSAAAGRNKVVNPFFSLVLKNAESYGCLLSLLLPTVII